MADKCSVYGEEVLCLAPVAAVQPTATGEPGHRPPDHPAASAEPGLGLDTPAGDAVADAPLAQPSAQVVEVVPLVGVQFGRSARSPGSGCAR